MRTIETLKAFGANTDEGVARCVNNADFYLRMVDMAVSDANFDKLSAAVDAGDLDSAFEAAHALKGILGNLSLDPITEPVVELTELLRVRTAMDYRPLLSAVLEKKRELESL